MSLTDTDIVIDALFGAGLDREVEGLPRAMIRAMNESGVPLIAVDLPSGINGTTGAVMGMAVKASHTVTFFRRKPGHLLLPGRLHCGTVEVADIGIPASVLETIKPQTFANDPALWGGAVSGAVAAGAQIQPRSCRGGVGRPVDHRGGAAGGARARCGPAPGSSPSPARARRWRSMRPSSLAVMVRPVDGAAELAEFLGDTRRNAVVLGPGGGVGGAMQDQVRAALASAAAVVLDADALTSFAGDPAALLTAILARRSGDTILTPHRRRISTYIQWYR